jgi:NAD+ synthase
MKLEKQNSPETTALIDDIAHWIRHQVKMAGVQGIVLGLSGGLDSSVAGVLCKKALAEADAVRGLILPCHSHAQDEAHALLVAQRFNIRTETIDLGPVFDLLVSILPPGGQLSVANLKPRLRMIALYYYANELGFLVVGSGNKSELLTGYFTKHGDGGVDLLPLGGLFKTEVRAVGEALGIPGEILEKPPSAGLWEGQTDEGEMGISYEELDRALVALQGQQTDYHSDEAMERVRQMVSRSRHKRTPIPRYER